MFVPLALVAVTLLPLLDRGRVKVARWIAVVVALTGIAWAHWASLYSELRPQRVNFTYVVDADENRANVSGMESESVAAPGRRRDAVRRKDKRRCRGSSENHRWWLRRT